MPLVSVIIPNYNCGLYIGKAIESIIVQSFQEWELLICDDGSTDNSIEVVKAWQNREKRIKLYVNEQNMGHIFTYNRLFQEAQGDYILIQDADDWSAPERIEKQLAVMFNFDVQLCLCNSIFQSKAVQILQQNAGSGYIDIKTTETWAPATLMFKRSVLEKVKGFSVYFERATSMDRYFIMDILDQYRGYYLEEYLYHVLVRSDSDHRSIDLNSPLALRKLIMHDVYLKLKEQRVETGTDWLKDQNESTLEEYERALLTDKSYLSDKLRVFACIQIDHNRKKQAWKLLVMAFRLAPFSINNYRSLLYLVRR